MCSGALVSDVGPTRTNVVFAMVCNEQTSGMRCCSFHPAAAGFFQRMEAVGWRYTNRFV